MASKGISPLISAALLLAVTLAVASIFSGWGPNLINTVTEDTTNQTEETLNCNDAGVEILSAKYYSSDSNTSIVLRNTGDEQLDELQASAWNNDLPMNKTVTVINSGNFTTVNVTTTSKPNEVQAHSRDCSSVEDIYEDIK